MSSERILVIDDEPSVARLLRLELVTQGYDVTVATSGEEGLRAFAADPPDLVLLDVVMPGASGLDVLKEIKAKSHVPVILITARSGEDVRMEAMAQGADDFISKPFSPEHVSKSVRYLLAPTATDEQGSLRLSVGDIEFDFHQHVAARAGVPIEINHSEWLILEKLAERPGEPLLYQELLSSVWGAEYRDDLDFLRVWMTRLTKKLEHDAARVIVPYLDVGYILNTVVPAVRLAP